MFSDVHRCFQMMTDVFGFSLDTQLFDDPKPFDDPQLFDNQLEVWTLTIQKSTVIPPSLMVLFIANFVITNTSGMLLLLLMLVFANIVITIRGCRVAVVVVIVIVVLLV